MKTPASLQPLVDDGIIETVVRRLQSGKEATVFIVVRAGALCCAKVYKDADHRGFHHLAQYEEGRKVRGSRDARALRNRGRHGRELQETQWKNAEVEALYRLREAGVRVPQPYGLFDGVLLMELITDSAGSPAPRLNDVAMTCEQADSWHAFMMEQIVAMLCAGLIHGDLSEFNVLVDSNGPVIIDMPQAVSAAGNNNAFRMLERDVNNMRDAFGRVQPALLGSRYAHELWSLHESGSLTPATRLTGHFELDQTSADVDSVLAHIENERFEAQERERRLQEASQS